jgi:hypothetical protein
MELGLKGGRNLCYEHNQQNQVHEHQCKKLGGGGGECEDFFIVEKIYCKYKNGLGNAHPAYSIYH